MHVHRCKVLQLQLYTFPHCWGRTGRGKGHQLVEGVDGEMDIRERLKYLLDLALLVGFGFMYKTVTVTYKTGTVICKTVTVTY